MSFSNAYIHMPLRTSLHDYLVYVLKVSSHEVILVVGLEHFAQLVKHCRCENVCPSIHYTAHKRLGFLNIVQHLRERGRPRGVVRGQYYFGFDKPKQQSWVRINCSHDGMQCT